MKIQAFHHILKFILSGVFISSCYGFNPEAPVGTLWYNTEGQENDNKFVVEVPEEIPAQQPQSNQLTAKQKLEIFREYFEEVKARAIVNPTDENLAEFQELTNVASNMSANFAYQHKKMRLEHPELDYAVKHPSSQIGANTYDAEMNKAEDEAISVLSKNHGLMFFYKGASMLDQQQSQILSTFSKKYDIPLMGISVDGTVIDSIDDNVVNQGQAETLGISAFPAIVLFNNQTNQVQPVKYGFSTIDELKRSLYAISKNYTDLETLPDQQEQQP